MDCFEEHSHTWRQIQRYPSLSGRSTVISFLVLFVLRFYRLASGTGDSVLLDFYSGIQQMIQPTTIWNGRQSSSRRRRHPPAPPCVYLVISAAFLQVWYVYGRSSPRAALMDPETAPDPPENGKKNEKKFLFGAKNETNEGSRGRAASSNGTLSLPAHLILVRTTQHTYIQQLVLPSCDERRYHLLRLSNQATRTEAKRQIRSSVIPPCRQHVLLQDLLRRLDHFQQMRLGREH